MPVSMEHDAKAAGLGDIDGQRLFIRTLRWVKFPSSPATVTADVPSLAMADRKDKQQY